MERVIGEYYCSECGKTVRGGLRRTIMVSGGIHVYRVCLDSGKEHLIRAGGGLYLSHAAALRYSGYPSIEDIQIGMDYRRAECSVLQCEVLGAENHHFAPKEAFGEDAERWPQLPLCRQHHAEWHNRMVGYRSKKEEA